MFNSHFPLNNRVIKTYPTPGEIFIVCHLYTFRSTYSNSVYIVRLEEFKYNLIAVKFYLKNHRLSNDKYKILTAKKEAIKVLSTCLQIMLIHLKRYPKSSFIIKASRGLGELEENYSKRFIVYRKIVEQFFSSLNFQHLKSGEELSVYILLNKKNNELDLLTKFIEDNVKHLKD